MKKLSIIFAAVLFLTPITFLTSCKKHDDCPAGYHWGELQDKYGNVYGDCIPNDESSSPGPCDTCGTGGDGTSHDDIWYAYEDPLVHAYKFVDSAGCQTLEKDNWGQPIEYHALKIERGSENSWALFENGTSWPGRETDIRRYFNAHPRAYLTIEVESHGNKPWGQFGTQPGGQVIKYHATGFYEL